MRKFLFPIALAMLAIACTEAPTKVQLTSWNEGEIKNKLLKFLEVDVEMIPIEDRVAVFDLDGTIACEAPLWFEMYVAVSQLNYLADKNPELLRYPEYQFAKRLQANPFDTLVQQEWVTPNANYIDSMIWKAFDGVCSEEYIAYANRYLSNTPTQDTRFNRPLSSLFYHSMVELLECLRVKQFKIYIVSGSTQGLLWSICPQQLDFDRNHLIGTRQAMSVQFKHEAQSPFTLKKGIYIPKNDGYGKAQNIYSAIGKKPVFAFGNTAGDFGMFHLASSSKYPNISFMLNHDDADREYEYPPYHGKPVESWQDSLSTYGWNLVSMKNDFKLIWIENP